MLGDYNAYAKEDPINAIRSAGFTNLVEDRLGADAYSYVFDGQWGYLDFAFASASMNAQVAGVAEFHINADEPSVLDYNTDFKTANLQTTLYAPDQFRVSDHDPVVVGFNLQSPNQPPTVSAGGPYSVGEGAVVTLTAAGVDPENGTLTYGWDLNNDGTFETAGASVSFSAGTLDGPSAKEVKVQVTDPNGATAVAVGAINVTNVAPKATPSLPTTGVAGVAVNLSLASPVDPSAADVAAGFTYAFDCGAGFGPFGSATQRTCPTTAAGTLAVGAAVRDKDGGTTEYRSTVTVAVTFDSLCTLSRSVVSAKVAVYLMCETLKEAERANRRGNQTVKQWLLAAYRFQVQLQRGRSVTAENADLLSALSRQL